MAAPRWATDDVRQRIEAHLPLDALSVLRWTTTAAGVPESRWLAVPSLRQTYGTAAVLAITGPLTENGMSFEAATRQASRDLGVPSETARGWVHAWRRHAWNFGGNST